MREDIYWVGAFKVKPEQFDDFRQVVAPLVAATKQGRERSRMSATSAKIAPQSIFLSTIEFPTLSYHVQQTFAKLADRFTALAAVDSFCRLMAPSSSRESSRDP